MTCGEPMTDEQFARLKHATALARESLAIAAELEEDAAVFCLKEAMKAFHCAIEMEAEGFPDREIVELTVFEAGNETLIRTRKSRRRPD